MTKKLQKLKDNCTPSSFYSSIYSNRIDEELDDPFEYKECPDHLSHRCINGRCYMDKDNITFCICPPHYEGPHCEYLTNDLSETASISVVILLAVLGICISIVLHYYRKIDRNHDPYYLPINMKSSNQISNLYVISTSPNISLVSNEIFHNRGHYSQSTANPQHISSNASIQINTTGNNYLQQEMLLLNRISSQKWQRNLTNDDWI